MADLKLSVTSETNILKMVVALFLPLSKIGKLLSGSHIIFAPVGRSVCRHGFRGVIRKWHPASRRGSRRAVSAARGVEASSKMGEAESTAFVVWNVKAWRGRRH